MRAWPFVLLGAGLGLAFACNEVQSYVFTARRYDPDAGCLASYVPIDEIPGRGVGNRCGPTCFRFENAIYTTRVCPPLPDAVEELDQQSPECLAANEPSIYDASCSADEPGDGGDAGSDDDDDEPVDAAVEGG